MEYVAGRTLRDILREGRKILPERALEITSGVLSALDYSHRAGIIHRDIKPGNVMLTPSGDVKVMDFGIARAISDASSTMTQTAAVVGTAQYLSPEQARGETVDSRSDVYSAGCLLYELLTGRPPFVGDSPVAVAYQHVREPALPPSDHDTDLPPEVDAIVMKALAKRVEDRYQSAAAMRSDIERYLAGRPVQAPVPPPVPADPADAVPHRGDGRWSRRCRPRTTSPRAAAHRPAGRARPAARRADRRRGLPDAAPVRVRARAGRGAEPDRHDRERRRATRSATPGWPSATSTARPATTSRAGKVISQDPDRRPVRRPRTPRSTSSSRSASPRSRCPFVVGRPKDEAQRRAARRQASRSALEEEESDERQGQGAPDRPAAGRDRSPQGTTVTVYDSDGPEEVPNVVGLTQAEAKNDDPRRRLRASRSIENPNTTEPAGTVTDQSPPGGTPRRPGHDGDASWCRPTSSRPPRRPPTRRPGRRSRPRSPPLIEPPATAAAAQLARSGRAERRRSGRAGRRTPAR